MTLAIAFGVSSFAVYTAAQILGLGTFAAVVAWVVWFALACGFMEWRIRAFR